MPALCAMLFYRNPEHRLATFHQEAPYLFDPAAPELAEYDSGIVNLECTKRAAAFGVWGVWSLLGTADFRRHGRCDDRPGPAVSRDAHGGRRLRAAARAAMQHRGVSLLAARTARCAPEKVDALQLRLRRAVIESGEFYLVQSRIDGRPVLRTTMMNPLTTVDDLRRTARMPAPLRTPAYRRRPLTPARPAACGLAIAALPHAKIVRFRAVLALIHLLPQVGKLCGRLAAVWFLRLRHFAVFPRFERL